LLASIEDRPVEQGATLAGIGREDDRAVRVASFLARSRLRRSSPNSVEQRMQEFGNPDFGATASDVVRNVWRDRQTVADL
jgi:hypothetical protein